MWTYNIAVVGIGKITQDQHLPVIARNPRFRLAAMVSQRGLAEPDVPTLKTTAEMLKAVPEIDAIAICTPPHARHAIARQALDAGKHLLLEKPTTTTTAELLDKGANEIDAAPLQLVADAFLVGKRVETEPFIW